MKKHLIPFGTALTLALFVTGCETDGGITARIQEKSAAYATLKPWDKHSIAKGVVSTGFTADMVYMAMGYPTRVRSADTPEGHAELWIYKDFYPSAETGKIQYNVSTEEGALLYTSGQIVGNGGPPAENPVKYMHLANGGKDIEDRGPPQGGSMEPAALQAATFLILFRDGKVTRIGIKPD